MLQSVPASPPEGAVGRIFDGSEPAYRIRGSRAAATPKTGKAHKLSFKETRELEGMEAQIHTVDEEIARIEGLFASAEFFRTHATQISQLTADLASAKEKLARLYARWEELEAIKAEAANR